MSVILIAFAAGVLVGLTGAGAGAILTPLVLIVTHFPAVTVIGTDLLTGASSKLAGVWEHRKLGQINWGLVGWLLGGSLPAALVGSYIEHLIEVRIGLFLTRGKLLIG